jgi:hypothetical protein
MVGLTKTACTMLAVLQGSLKTLATGVRQKLIKTDNENAVLDLILQIIILINQLIKLLRGKKKKHLH